MMSILLLMLLIFNGPGEAVPASSTLPVDRLKLPPGFSVSVFASKVKNARSMALGPKGILFVSTRSEGKVYALVDRNGDNKADVKYTLAENLNMPNGIAYRDGALFVAEVSRVLRYDNIADRLENPPAPVVVYDQFPSDTHHGWKYIAFGPDGKLYVPVGAPCNICNNEDKKPVYAAIHRINPDGTGLETVARGVRNTVGFTWHPGTKKLWFTDNGRDWMGDDLPPCELNVVNTEGEHFGYPFVHGTGIKDKEFGDKAGNRTFTFPARDLGAHTAPLGVKFYTGTQFPAAFRNNVAFIAEHGSWNRSKKSGYRIMMVAVDGSKGTSYEPFISGWLDEAKDAAWGRPVDLLELPDGSILISDDFADAIYRVTYSAR
jgi:glucose/arabinose dehydrogenase